MSVSSELNLRMFAVVLVFLVCRFKWRDSDALEISTLFCSVVILPSTAICVQQDKPRMRGWNRNDRLVAEHKFLEKISSAASHGIAWFHLPIFAMTAQTKWLKDFLQVTQAAFQPIFGPIAFVNLSFDIPSQCNLEDFASHCGSVWILRSTQCSSVIKLGFPMSIWSCPLFMKSLVFASIYCMRRQPAAHLFFELHFLLFCYDDCFVSKSICPGKIIMPQSICTKYAPKHCYLPLVGTNSST